jgi:hypothetical protein
MPLLETVRLYDIGIEYESTVHAARGCDDTTVNVSDGGDSLHATVMLALPATDTFD